MGIRAKICLLLVGLAAYAAVADPLRSFDEFKRLAEELAPKVNLFHDAWAIDPAAEFYGGTTRDYLYWILGKLKEGKTPDELRAMPIIDVREFIVGESDVDIVAAKTDGLAAERYGVRKIDAIHGARFDPSTPEGRNELNQGYVPVEKIRLGRQGFVPWSGVGDGIREIHSGHLTVHFSPREIFDQTHYAKHKLNHPILLALRFLRLVAIDYFKRNGNGYPDKVKLMAIDPQSLAAVRAVIRSAATTEDLAPYLAQATFKGWLNATVRKAFLSYTNPTAAKVLFDDLGVSDLISRYPELKTYNQFVFARRDDPAAVAAHRAQYGLDPKTFHSPVGERFPGLQLFHGTRADEGFRAILFQGILPSDTGTAGAGLYGVASDNIKFAEEWAHSEDRVVRFEISPSAVLVDVTQGEGKRAFEAFRKTYEGKDPFTGFAEYFGADILKYEYKTTAYVVKNSAVLSKARGHKVDLMPLSVLLARAGEVRDLGSLTDFVRALRFNHFSKRERELALDELERRTPDAALRAGVAGARQLADGNRVAPFPFMEVLIPELTYSASRDPARLEALGRTLAEMAAGNPEAMQPVIERLIDQNPKLAVAGVFAELAKAHPVPLVEVWKKLGERKLAVVDSLGRGDTTASTGHLLAHLLVLADPNPKVRASLAAADETVRFDRGRDWLDTEVHIDRGFSQEMLHLMDDSDPSVRVAAMDRVRARARSTYIEVTDTLVGRVMEELFSPHETVRQAAFAFFKVDTGLDPRYIDRYFRTPDGRKREKRVLALVAPPESGWTKFWNRVRGRKHDTCKLLYHGFIAKNNPHGQDPDGAAGVY